MVDPPLPMILAMMALGAWSMRALEPAAACVRGGDAAGFGHEGSRCRVTGFHSSRAASRRQLTHARRSPARPA